jgi:uncharacterized protein
MMTHMTQDNKYVSILKDMILSRIDRGGVMVFLFGSRATGRHSSRADIDVGFLAKDKLPPRLLHDIQNAVDESIIPLNVDLVDFTNVDSAFKHKVLKGIKIWNIPADMMID